MENIFEYSDLVYLAIPLPADIAALHHQGRFEEEIARIDHRLALTPDEPMKKRLELEKFIAEGLMDDYTTDEQTLVRKIRERFPSFTSEHLYQIMDMGHADYIIRPDGYYFQDAARSNIFNCCSTFLHRLEQADYRPSGNENADLHENIAIMRKNGYRAIRYTVRESLWLEDRNVREGKWFRAWLPYPCVTPEISDIKLLKASHMTQVTEHPIRTAYTQFLYRAGEKYEIEVAFTNRAEYRDIDEGWVTDAHPYMPQYLEEQYPHIVFTPYLRMLEKEITGGKGSPLTRARRIYEYITHNVKYSYMREYRYIDNIPMFAALNHRGDCGVQALLFITLCRISGIPARWQSGNYITPGHIGSHDWAQFYVAPYGWLQCDPSFGGGAYRIGDDLVHDFYFCHADPFRYICCTEFQMQLNPAKKFMRLDPYDNQSGEAEYDDMVLQPDDVCTWKEVVSAEEK
ncbi:MAG: transglutaminase domain-containing protein [Clostridia bacterium]|nr:transglutaminase domain-containing protein [Clostridia bacterium]